jgi:hypothetical protein
MKNSFSGFPFGKSRYDSILEKYGDSSNNFFKISLASSLPKRGMQIEL